MSGDRPNADPPIDADSVDGSDPPFDHQTEVNNVQADDHHSRYTDGEAESAINDDGDHGSTASHNYIPNVPGWTEETGSPYTATGGDSAQSITPSGLDAFDMYLVFVKVADREDIGNPVDMQIDGETGNNYQAILMDGTKNTGLSELGNVYQISGNNAGVFSFILSHGAGQDGHMYRSRTGNMLENFVDAGRQLNTSWPPSQFTLDRFVDSDWTVEIFGRDIG